MHSKIKWKTDSHIHIVFSPNNSTLLFILSKYFSFHSFPTTIHNIAKTQWNLFLISFSFTRFNAWFSSAALLAGVDSALPSHWLVLWVFWVVFFCVASELRSDRICVNHGELHGTKAQQIQRVGKREAGLGVIAINPLCRVNIFGSPQIGTLCVPSALIFPSLPRIESPKLTT